MPAIQGDDIADLVASTLKDLGPGKWVDLASDLQEYIALPKILNKEKVGFQSGYGLQWNVMVDTADAAQNAGLYAVDNVNVGDMMKNATLPWRHSLAAWAYERREISMNRSPARIVEILKERRAGAMIDLAKLIENNFWGKPAGPTDTLTPHGIDYWIVRNSSEGFNGGIPSGWSDVAGLSPTTYPNWKNYTAQYTTVDKTDLIRKMRRAFVFTKFKSPTEIPTYNKGNRYGIYSNYAVVGKLEEILESQNDKLGNDIASKDGMVMFRRTPIQWVPKLETDAQNPIYGINWGWFRPVFLKGEYMRETGPQQAPHQHNVQQVFLDLTYNFECKNRRAQWVIATA